MTKALSVIPMPFMTLLEKNPNPMRLELFSNGKWQEWATYNPDPESMQAMMDVIGKLLDFGFWFPATMRVLEVIDDD